jgi:NAD(P)-dependent dehydrogenase (short-subunit alcohol dehydrogenase family)
MESPIAFVTGADRGLGMALTAGLLERGWQVFAGQYMPDWAELSELAARYPGKLTSVPLDVASIESARAAAAQVAGAAPYVDVLINNAGVISTSGTVSIREQQNYDEMHRMFDVNALGPLRVVEAFLPLVERSSMKRLCFVSSEAGSIGRAKRQSWFGYCMSKSALNMAVKILFNDLHPQGYSFRVYHPGWVRSYMGGKKNMEATLEPEEAAVPALNYFLCGLPGEQGEPVDEDRLVLRDYQNQEWPW